MFFNIGETSCTDRDTSTPTYVTVLVFFGGLFCGVILLCVILLVRRRCKGGEKEHAINVAASSNYENVGAVNAPAYQELNLSELSGGEKYQSPETTPETFRRRQSTQGKPNRLRRAKPSQGKQRRELSSFESFINYSYL